MIKVVVNNVDNDPEYMEFKDEEDLLAYFESYYMDEVALEYTEELIANGELYLYDSAGTFYEIIK